MMIVMIMTIMMNDDVVNAVHNVHRDGKSGKRGKRACAIFFPSCANFWAVYAQKC